MTESNGEDLLERTRDTRELIYGGLGKLLPHVFIAFQDSGMRNRWPAQRQAWSVIELEKSLVILSDGLSDPDLSTGIQTGLGHEFFIELPRSESDYDKWPLELLTEVCNIAVDHAGIKLLIQEMNLISLEVFNSSLPGEFRSKEGTAGIILGLPSIGIPGKLSLPAGEILLINIKLLTQGELTFIREHGEAGREILKSHFMKGEQCAVSSIHRKSVV